MKPQREGKQRRRVLLLLLALAAGGCKPRSSEPRLVEPEILGSPRDERSVAFSPDGGQAFFPVRVGDGYLQALCTATRTQGRWSEPEVLPFSGGPAFDADPFMGADGNRLYFASSRTADGKPKRGLDLWVVERSGSGWSEPRLLLGDTSSASRRSPAIARSGRLFFVSTDESGSKIFAADPTSGGWKSAQALSGAVNGEGQVAMLAIDASETILVLAVLGRRDEIVAPGQNYPRGDLYVSFRANGGWSAPRHLNPPLNSAASELSPSFSSDGRWLYFMSERGFATDQTAVLTGETLAAGLASSLNGRGNIYRVETSALEAYR